RFALASRERCHHVHPSKESRSNDYVTAAGGSGSQSVPAGAKATSMEPNRPEGRSNSSARSAIF
ncbi:MAG TPA: hypothetical protein VFV80_06310, partial [Geminicoccaceae bacterium]|nr:hypothetical protein [Geminicoccaceae bacterium]